jgi:tetratricopeptide (TPR) repeat protein
MRSWAGWGLWAIGSTLAPSRAHAQAATALTAQADQAAAAHDTTRALSLYESAIETDREYLSAWDGLANLLLAERRYEELIGRLRPFLDHRTDYATGWYNLAYAYRKTERFEQARDAYRAFALLRPDNPDPYYGLGYSLNALGDAAGAAEAFRRYLALENRPAEARWVRKARLELARLEKPRRKPSQPVPIASGCSEPDARAAVRRDPTSAAAYERLLGCLQERRRFAAQETAARAALRDAPTFDRAWFFLGEALRGLGRPAEAVQAYRKFLANRPGDADGVAGLARAEHGQAGGDVSPPPPIEAGKAPAAVVSPVIPPAPAGCVSQERRARDSLRADPTDEAAYDALLSCLHERKQAQALDAASRAALRDAPGVVRAWFYLGEALAAQSRFAESVAAYRKYLQKRPSDEAARLALEEAEKAGGR